MIKNDNNFDLNIDNYDLNDLLSLFDLEIDFNEYHLKKAKKIVLMLHPDKSKLDPQYFLFYTKAYKKIYDIYEFKNKNNNKIEQVKYDNDIDENIKNVLNNSFKDNKDFNTRFNILFEKYNLSNDDIGYGEWLKSNDDIYEKNINFNDINAIEKKKKELQSIIQYKGVMELNLPTIGSAIEGISYDNNSNLFSSLHYSDLRDAHRESIIPVTIDDYNNIPKYNSVEEYKTNRNNIDMDLKTIQENEEYLKNKKLTIEEEANKRAFLLAKQTEEAIMKNKLFMSEFYRIK